MCVHVRFILVLHCYSKQCCTAFRDRTSFRFLSDAFRDGDGGGSTTAGSKVRNSERDSERKIDLTSNLISKEGGHKVSYLRRIVESEAEKDNRMSYVEIRINGNFGTQDSSSFGRTHSDPTQDTTSDPTPDSSSFHLHSDYWKAPFSRGLAAEEGFTEGFFGWWESNNITHFPSQKLSTYDRVGEMPIEFYLSDDVVSKITAIITPDYLHDIQSFLYQMNLWPHGVDVEGAFIFMRKKMKERGMGTENPHPFFKYTFDEGARRMYDFNKVWKYEINPVFRPPTSISTRFTAETMYQSLHYTMSDYLSDNRIGWVGRRALESAVVLPPVFSAAFEENLSGKDKKRYHIIDVGCFAGDFSYSALKLWENAITPSISSYNQIVNDLPRDAVWELKGLLEHHVGRVWMLYLQYQIEARKDEHRMAYLQSVSQKQHQKQQRLEILDTFVDFLSEFLDGTVYMDDAKVLKRTADSKMQQTVSTSLEDVEADQEELEFGMDQDESKVDKPIEFQNYSTTTVFLDHLQQFNLFIQRYKPLFPDKKLSAPKKLSVHCFEPSKGLYMGIKGAITDRYAAEENDLDNSSEALSTVWNRFVQNKPKFDCFSKLSLDKNLNTTNLLKLGSRLLRAGKLSEHEFANLKFSRLKKTYRSGGNVGGKAGFSSATPIDFTVHNLAVTSNKIAERNSVAKLLCGGTEIGRIALPSEAEPRQCGDTEYAGLGSDGVHDIGLVSVDRMFPVGKKSLAKIQRTQNGVTNLLPPHDEILVLKIDTEGTDIDVLHGAEGLLDQKKVRYVVYELEEPPQLGQMGVNLQDLSVNTEPWGKSLNSDMNLLSNYDEYAFLAKKGYPYCAIFMVDSVLPIGPHDFIIDYLKGLSGLNRENRHQELKANLRKDKYHYFRKMRYYNDIKNNSIKNSKSKPGYSPAPDLTSEYYIDMDLTDSFVDALYHPLSQEIYPKSVLKMKFLRDTICTHSPEYLDIFFERFITNPQIRAVLWGSQGSFGENVDHGETRERVNEESDSLKDSLKSGQAPRSRGISVKHKIRPDTFTGTLERAMEKVVYPALKDDEKPDQKRMKRLREEYYSDPVFSKSRTHTKLPSSTSHICVHQKLHESSTTTSEDEGSSVEAEIDGSDIITNMVSSKKQCYLTLTSLVSPDTDPFWYKFQNLWIEKTAVVKDILNGIYYGLVLGIPSSIHTGSEALDDEPAFKTFDPADPFRERQKTQKNKITRILFPVASSRLVSYLDNTLIRFLGDNVEQMEQAEIVAFEKGQTVVQVGNQFEMSKALIEFAGMVFRRRMQETRKLDLTFQIGASNVVSEKAEKQLELDLLNSEARYVTSQIMNQAVMVARYYEKQARSSNYLDYLWLLCGAEILYRFAQTSVRHLQGEIGMIGLDMHGAFGNVMNHEDNIIHGGFQGVEGVIGVANSGNGKKTKKTTPCSILVHYDILRPSDLDNLMPPVAKSATRLLEHVNTPTYVFAKHTDTDLGTELKKKKQIIFSSTLKSHIVERATFRPFLTEYGNETGDKRNETGDKNSKEFIRQAIRESEKIFQLWTPIDPVNDPDTMGKIVEKVRKEYLMDKEREIYDFHPILNSVLQFLRGMNTYGSVTKEEKNQEFKPYCYGYIPDYVFLKHPLFDMLRKGLMAIPYGFENQMTRQFSDDDIMNDPSIISMSDAIENMVEDPAKRNRLMEERDRAISERRADNKKKLSVLSEVGKLIETRLVECGSRCGKSGLEIIEVREDYRLEARRLGYDVEKYDVFENETFDDTIGWLPPRQEWIPPLLKWVKNNTGQKERDPYLIMRKLHEEFPILAQFHPAIVDSGISCYLSPHYENQFQKIFSIEYENVIRLFKQKSLPTT